MKQMLQKVHSYFITHYSDKHNLTNNNLAFIVAIRARIPPAGDDRKDHLC